MSFMHNGIPINKIIYNGVEVHSVYYNGVGVFGENIIFDSAVGQQTAISPIFTNNSSAIMEIHYEIQATTSTVGSGTSVSLTIDNSDALVTSYYGDDKISGVVELGVGKTLQLVQDRCACNLRLYYLG